MSKESLYYDIIRYPLITEKSSLAAEDNKVTFAVSSDSTKGQIKAAVESLFNVKVSAVNTINAKGKTKRFRGIQGKRSDVKKAIVKIAEGYSIDMSAGV